MYYQKRDQHSIIEHCLEALRVVCKPYQTRISQPEPVSDSKTIMKNMLVEIQKHQMKIESLESELAAMKKRQISMIDSVILEEWDNEYDRQWNSY